jgi:polyisoprenoid-binding protein YceI
MTSHVSRLRLIVWLLVSAGLPAFARERAPVPAVSLYAIDSAHSLLEFSVRLVGFNRVRGSFEKYHGHVLLASDDITRSKVSVVIESDSIRTGVEERDRDLKSANFFDAAKYPSLTFASTRIEKTPSGFVAIGPLAIHGVSREIRIPFVLSSPPGTDPFGNTRFAITAEVTFNRSDFGVNGPEFWGKAISDAVQIDLEIAGRRWNYETLGWSQGASPPSASSS